MTSPMLCGVHKVSGLGGQCLPVMRQSSVLAAFPCAFRDY